MKNNKVMLIYGFDETEKSKLEKVIEENNLPGYKVITSVMTKMKIGEILDGFKFEIVNSKLPEEKVILFNNFDDNELDNTIKKVKIINSKVIMAVVTPVSIEWTFDYLIEHLIEERNWYMSRKA